MRKTTNFAIAAFAWTALCGVSLGQEPAARQDAPRDQAREQTKVEIAQVLRTADIIGTAVRNKQNENLGKIDDLVIDMKTGEVRYAALGYGGVAGIGAKMFAVPLNKLTYKLGEPNNREARHFVFDVPKSQLDNADGFDTSHWPKFADAKFSGTEAQRATNIQPGREGADVAFETVFRASKIKGMDVRNEKNENLGSVDELVVDLTKAHTKYLALSFGSVFTGGNKLFAVPLAHCTLTHANDKTFIKLVGVSQDALKSAPGFDKNQWPDMADPEWHRRIDAHYQRTATRPANQP
jgi:sporulation protein YlmC with PRC-barrel domain